MWMTAPGQQFPNADAFRGQFVAAGLFLVWLARTPHWARGDAEAATLLRRMRLCLVIGWALGSAGFMLIRFGVRV
jgi:hypothetical protein